MFKSTKTYDHNEGLSTVFRQWRAEDTHCKYLHGYALKFRFTFVSSELDERNWVQNFGGLKPLKEWLHFVFDHTTLVAFDDPEIQRYYDMRDAGLIQLREIPATGCEKIAQLAFEWVNSWLDQQSNRVWCAEVEVSEHPGNSAIYTGKEKLI